MAPCKWIFGPSIKWKGGSDCCQRVENFNLEAAECAHLMKSCLCFGITTAFKGYQFGLTSG